MEDGGLIEFHPSSDSENTGNTTEEIHIVYRVADGKSHRQRRTVAHKSKQEKKKQ